jgi:hypothetical protein
VKRYRYNFCRIRVFENENKPAQIVWTENSNVTLAALVVGSFVVSAFRERIVGISTPVNESCSSIVRDSPLLSESAQGFANGDFA